MSEDYIQTNGSLDCCTKEEIKENKLRDLECTICKNTGYLLPNSAKEHLNEQEKKDGKE